MTLTDLELETRLRDQSARAAEIPPAPVDLAQRVRQRARVERRRQIRLAAAGVAAALVFVGLPVLASNLTADGSRGETAAPSSSRAPAPSHLDVPTRGSLADDEEWVEEVRALSWLPEYAEDQVGGAELPDPALGDRKVVFAGDVPGGRVALVMARVDSGLVRAWYTGPERARPADMRLASQPGDAPRRDPLALVAMPDPASDEAVLVLVTRPGDEAEVLTGREVTATAETRELWKPLPLEDGAGALALGADLLMPPVMDVRITRPGERMPTFPQFSFSDDVYEAAGPHTAVADPRGLLGIADPEQLQWSVQSLAANYGIPVEQLRPTLLAAGPVSAGSTTAVLLIGITFPSGATTAFLTTSWGSHDQAMTAMYSPDPAPAGTALLDRLIAVATSNVVTVSAPSGVTAEVYRDDGTLLTTVPLVQGAGSAALAPPSRPYERALLTVRLLDGAGNVLGETTVEQER